jgi:hypothetical protein
MLAGDAQLQLQFLVKVTHELREAQHPVRSDQERGRPCGKSASLNKTCSKDHPDNRRSMTGPMSPGIWGCRSRP